MRRALHLILFGIFVTSGVVGLMFGYVAVNWMTRNFIERDLAVTHAAIERKFRTFDVLLEHEERQMERRMAEALPILARELLGDPPGFMTRTDEQLAELSRRAGVDNLYIIDRNTVIVATDFLPDKGFELGTISAEIRSFLTGLVGRGKFVADRINMSSKTGILTKYGYWSPPGSDYIAEVSIDVRKYLARERSPAFVDFLFGTFFRDLVKTHEYLTGIDIHMVNPVGRFSLFDRNTNLPPAIYERLRTEDRVVEHYGNHWRVYSKISPVASRLSTASFLAVTTDYDFSAMAHRMHLIIIALGGAMIVASAIAYLAIARIATRRVVARIEAIRQGVSTIAEGNYAQQLIVGGQDEINDIADDINVMRRRIEKDIERRETDAKALQQAFAEAENARQAAEAANQAKTQFLSSVSHELRTPLHAITGYAQMMKLEEEQSGSTDRSARLERILKASDQLSRIVANLLDLSQAEKGVLPIRIATVAPGPLIGDAVLLVEPNAALRQISLHNRIAGTLPNVHADAERLSQVLLNLLANSVKFSNDGGSVLIDALIQADRTLRISITDTGPGIPEGMADRVFQWFERLGKEAGSIEGVGIGLALSHDLVTRMGGRIGFENLRQGGCMFWIELPLSVDAAVSATDGPAAPTGASAGNDRIRGSVLYIEDNPALRDLMTAIFTRLPDCSLHIRDNAEDGLRLAAAERPDLILMDINLPGMDGIAACKRLKQDPATADIPVIAVTGAAMAHDRERARDAGFAAYLVKPFPVKEALDQISAILSSAAKSTR